MTAKEFMDRAYRIGVRIKLKEEQLASIREHVSHITGSYGFEQVSHSRNVSSMSDDMVRIIEYEKSMEGKIAELCAIRDETHAVINSIDDRTCRLLLESRFVNDDRWDKTAATIGLSIRQAQRKVPLALQKVEAVLREKEAGNNA